jgi:hypothetical protein
MKWLLSKRDASKEVVYEVLGTLFDERLKTNG